MAALERAKREYGPDILIEAGPLLLTEFLSLGLVDQLELSITQVVDGEHKISLNDALRNFEIVSDETVDETRFVIAKKR